MVKDSFPSRSAAESYSDGFEVTPDDDNDLVQTPQALWVGGTGDVSVTLASGDVTFVAVPDGTLLKVRAIRVLESTTATDIVALV